MARLIVTAQVEDATSWEEGFRTHGDLFKEQTVTAVHLGANEQNEVATYWEVDDLDKYLALLDSQETAEAMEADGVKRETVKVFVLDKQFNP